MSGRETTRSSRSPGSIGTSSISFGFLSSRYSTSGKGEEDGGRHGPNGGTPHSTGRPAQPPSCPFARNGARQGIEAGSRAGATASYQNLSAGLGLPVRPEHDVLPRRLFSRRRYSEMGAHRDIHVFEGGIDRL